MGSRLDRITDWPELAERAGYRVKEMARMGEMNRRQLPRFFSHKFGHTPQHWLQELRLSRAKELLAQGKSIKETARELGFAHAANFYNFFRYLTGETPRAYAKAHFINGSTASTRVAD